MPSIETLTYPFVMALTSVIAIGIILGLRVLAKYIKGKTQNQFVIYIMTVVEALAAKVVADTYQAYVEPLKAAGNWDDATKKIAADKALAALKSYLGPDGLARVASILGQGAQTDDFLKSFLESAVLSSKPVIASSLPTLPPQSTDTPSATAVVSPSNPN